MSREDPLFSPYVQHLCFWLHTYSAFYRGRSNKQRARAEARTLRARREWARDVTQREVRP